jgi:membrane associated rhomboid family serine protease
MVFAYLLIFSLIAVQAASAYVDPGTGSMIVQAAIAVFVGGVAFIGVFWRRIFRKKRSDEHDEDRESKTTR